MGTVPAAFEPRSLDVPPVPYADEPGDGPTGPSFADGLRAAFNGAEKGFAPAGSSPL